MSWLWMFLVGLIVGIVAKFLMPGKDPGGFIITAILALVVVNALGSCVDPTTGELYAVSFGLPGEFPPLSAPQASELAAARQRAADLVPRWLARRGGLRHDQPQRSGRTCRLHRRRDRGHHPVGDLSCDQAQRLITQRWTAGGPLPLRSNDACEFRRTCTGSPRRRRWA